jgi:uncharacterized protein YjbI with pentapeptide repeats
MRRNPTDLERALSGDKNLDFAEFRGITTNSLNLAAASLIEAVFHKANARSTDFAGSDCFRLTVLESDLSLSNFSGCRFMEVIARDSNFSGSNFQAARLSDTTFTNCNLKNVDFRRANLQHVRFKNCDLTGANLIDAATNSMKVENCKLDGVILIERSQQESNVNQVVKTAEFKRWFGNSKIRTPEGKPKILYHGTPAGGFSAFDIKKVDEWHPGFFFTDDLELAQTYSGFSAFDPFDAKAPMSSVYRVFVKMENPYVYDAGGAGWNNIEWKGKTVNTDKIGHWAKNNGFDGVILLNVLDEGGFGTGALPPKTVYIVFDPRNVKSAAYNRGTWDPNDSDMRHNPKKNPFDLQGRHIPERYLAGLPAPLRQARIRELTGSRNAYHEGDFSELPTDVQARKLGLVRPSGYTMEAKRRGIEWRGDTLDMARRVLRYYGSNAAPERFAQALDQVFRKGLAAWKSGGHRPGATAYQWAVARVNSLVVGGKGSRTADTKEFEVLPVAVRRKIESMR